MRLCKFSVVVLLFVLLCASCDSSDDVTSSSHTQDSQLTPEPTVSETVVDYDPDAPAKTYTKRTGWLNFDRSKFVEKNERSCEGTRAICSTSYSPKDRLMISLSCQPNNDGCPSLPLGSDYIVEDVIALDSGRKVFAIRANLSSTDPKALGTGARYLVTFVDSDGDGTFESFPQAGFDVTVPNWARK